MDTIVRYVRDIDADGRRALEHLLGRRLDEDQQLVIRVLTPDKGPAAEPGSEVRTAGPSARLPEWCNVFDGLTDNQVGDVEGAIVRRSDLTRPSE